MDTIQVSNIKCTTGDSSMNPDSGRGPSSTTVTMCLRAWKRNPVMVDLSLIRPLPQGANPHYLALTSHGGNFKFRYVGINTKLIRPLLN